MRKNGINRELREIVGGVCAPEGFFANGVHCGIAEDEEQLDLGLIVADWRCPAACLFSVSSQQSGPACVSKRHLKYGVARAILVNSVVANVFLLEGERLAEKACRALARRSDIDSNDTIIASTGKIGGNLTLQMFENGVSTLAKGVEHSPEGSMRVAQTIKSPDDRCNEVAFEFDLGDFPCKIGAVFKGNMRVAPNMATTLVFLTTDINITSEMLQKALSATVKDTFNLLCVDGISSPNDTICIMANGKAGNYKIFCTDTEYEKFIFALKNVLGEICKKITQNGDEKGRALLCKVTGAKSQQTARALSRRIIASPWFRQAIQSDNIFVKDIFFEINAEAGDIDFSMLKIAIQSVNGCFVLHELGESLPINKEILACITDAEEVQLLIELNAGNYRATAYGCVEIKERKE